MPRLEGNGCEHSREHPVLTMACPCTTASLGVPVAPNPVDTPKCSPGPGSIQGLAFTNSLRLGSISCRAPKVVQPEAKAHTIAAKGLEMSTTNGTHKVNTPQMAAMPAQFHPAEFIS